ncbi:MAG TPA: hypothetical protein VI688_07580 [Anaerolineales bacterium]|nr:hypothetical protein [Anaerolineales bacterium]HLE74090.1 hypothetical protein [Anaerolineales bacterium]
MDTGTIGKWAWLIALVVWVVVYALAGLGVDLGLPTIVTDIVAALAFLGGLLYVAGMKDRTGFFITALALSAFSAAAGMLFVEQLGGLVAGILGGAAAAAAAASAGALIMVIYDWVMGAMK